MRGRPPLRQFEVTERQREVARLVEEGKTNPEIAAALGISLDGAKYHVSELLVRLGLARREEIADWYRAQQGSTWQRARRRLRAAFALPTAWVGGGAAAAVLSAAVVIALSGASDGARAGDGATDMAAASPSPAVTESARETVTLPQPGPATAIQLADFEHHLEGDHWEAQWSSDLAEGDLVFILSWEVDPLVHILDRTTRRYVGEISVAYNPAILHRRAAQQLLIADLAPGDSVPGTIAPRLLVFGLAGGLSLDAVIPLPERPQYVGYSDAWIALSGNERYLYYARHGAEYSVSVAVLDIEDGGALVTAFGLPERCYPPGLHPLGSSAMLSACGDEGLVRVLSPDRSTGDEFAVGGLAGSGAPSHLFNLAAAIETTDGIGFIYYHGAYARSGPAGVELAGRALPAEKHLFPTGGISRIDATRLLIAYRDAYHETVGSGFVVFNTETAAIERDVAVRHQGAYVLDSDEIAILGEGRIDLLDLATMTFTQSFTNPSQPVVLPR